MTKAGPAEVLQDSRMKLQGSLGSLVLTVGSSLMVEPMAPRECRFLPSTLMRRMNEAAETI